MDPASIPLGLYVHVPWCVRKCPYCDFNSHRAPQSLPERAYVDALLADLEQDLAWVPGRRIQTVFLGGGTPSLLSAAAAGRLLSGIAARAPLAPDAEITLEANPGTVDRQRFGGFKAAGVNRLSIGVQSFDDRHLAALGRVHDREAALRAVAAAYAAGFDNLNLDLMFGLPGQTQAQAAADLETAIGLDPPHLSHYQLTLEPGTPFHRRPPPLPGEEALWEMQQCAHRRLAEAGYEHYEVSAFARPGARCGHNLCYWTFGDYLGIGAGAHGKVSGHDRITRIQKLRHPSHYLRQAPGPGRIATREDVRGPALVLELMLNALRLTGGVPAGLVPGRTGLPLQAVDPALAEGRALGLLDPGTERLRATALGRRYLDDLLLLFAPEARCRA